MTIATLTRLIVLLLAVLCAPAGALARVRGFNLVQLFLFARGLEMMQARGEKLRRPGESLATVYARIDLMAWLALDPFAALKHMGRRLRGRSRVRCLAVLAPAGAPVAVMGAPVVCLVAPTAFADSS